ncbi:MAG TPA: thiolase family protein [Acidimicrobiales bacterium]|nr:thiolase family protein [Acidimicrobiales bacterium]
MSARFAASGKVAVVGYAQSPIRRHADVPLGALTIETSLRAIEDAGLDKHQIDGFTASSLLPASGGQAIVDGVSTVSSAWLIEQLGVEPRFASGFQGGGQLPGAVILAVNAIASGAADYVLVHRAMFNPGGRYNENPMTEAAGSAQWTAPQGFWGAVSTVALPYQEYLQRYGATREDMANVVVEARKNGAEIPWSHWYRRPITVDDYLDARMVADPISVLDCDIPVTGVGAFVLTSAERAADLPHKPVYVAGFAQGLPSGPSHHAHWTLEEIMEGGAATARRLWESSGLCRDDVDLPQLYDGFSPLVYFWLEVLGYCPRGEAHRFVRDGRIAADGGLPVLSGGGALGNGRMHGVPQMLECYLQLSGRAGDRQRTKADVGLAAQAPPHIAGAVLYTAEPA